MPTLGRDNTDFMAQYLAADQADVGDLLFWVDTSVDPALVYWRPSPADDWLPVGATGGGGGGGSTYTHNQIAAASTWTITHMLGQHPSVTIVDSSGNVVVGDVEYINSNQIVVTFSVAFSGLAYLN